MQQVTDHSSFNVDVFKGLWPEVHDTRMEVIEAVVCEYYHVNRDEITTWHNTSEARMMNAFLMHYLLKHSLRFLEKYYRIYYHAMRYEFTNFYQRALIEPIFKNKLDSLIKAYQVRISSETSSNKPLNTY